jgi:hypothetical protein
VVANFSKKEELIRLKFLVPQNEMDRNIIRQGQVVVTLSERLVAKWHQSGRKSNGLRVENNMFFLTGENAWIGDILLKPKEMYGINLQFKINNTSNTEKKSPFHLDVLQYTLTGGKEVLRGGERYVINEKKSFYYKAIDCTFSFALALSAKYPLSIF